MVSQRTLSELCEIHDERRASTHCYLLFNLKAIKNNYSYQEIPVKYRNRIGVSKVSGTIKGAIFAGVNILYWIFKYSFKK